MQGNWQNLAFGLAIKAAEVGHWVLFPTLEQLMGKLKRASQENCLERQLHQLACPKVPHRRSSNLTDLDQEN